jgi:hypothetical protein
MLLHLQIMERANLIVSIFFVFSFFIFIVILYLLQKMARISFILVLLCQILTIPILGARSEDENPFLDLASSFLQNMGDGGNGNGLGALGNIMGSLMQGDNAQNLGAMFGQNNNGGNSGDILSGN